MLLACEPKDRIGPADLPGRDTAREEDAGSSGREPRQDPKPSPGSTGGASGSGPEAQTEGRISPDAPDAGDAGTDGGPTDEETGGGPGEVEIGRANFGVAAWEIDLAAVVLGTTRDTTSEYTAYSPKNWIATSTVDCDVPGASAGLKAACPFGTGVVGVCETRYYDSGEIVDTTLLILDAFLAGSASDADKRSVYAHEIGHCLGLDHVNDPSHLMYPTTQGADVPSAAELAAIAEVYRPIGPPSESTKSEFFMETPDGRAVRQYRLPSFTLGGVAQAASWEPTVQEELRVPLRGPVHVRRHYMRVDGACFSEAVRR